MTVFVREDDRWQSYTGGSGGGISWTVLGGGHRGVLRYGVKLRRTPPARGSDTRERSTGCRFDTGTSCSWHGTPNPTRIQLSFGSSRAETTLPPRARLWDGRVFGHTEGHDHAARGVRWLATRPREVDPPKVDPPRDLSGDEAAAALLRSLGFEKVTVVFEQPPAT
jgi:hypothetical protein